MIQMKPEIKELMEGVTKQMSHDEELVTEYKTWKNENERINASIINEERNEAHQEGLEEGIELGLERGIKKGKEQGIKEGKVQGALNAKREIVLEMCNKKIPLDIISECTHLTLDEIKAIIETGDYGITEGTLNTKKKK